VPPEAAPSNPPSPASRKNCAAHTPRAVGHRMHLAASGFLDIRCRESHAHSPFCVLPLSAEVVTRPKSRGGVPLQRGFRSLVRRLQRGCVDLQVEWRYAAPAGAILQHPSRRLMVNRALAPSTGAAVLCDTPCKGLLGLPCDRWRPGHSPRLQGIARPVGIVKTGKRVLTTPP
jgi:hypothetical protein